MKPERHNLRQKAIRTAHEVPIVGPQIEKFLKERAEWMVALAKVRKYLEDRIIYTDDQQLEVLNGPTILAIGAGKGHEMDEMDQQLPGAHIIGVDPHDHWAGPIRRDMQTLANDVSYLPEGVSAEHLDGIDDSSVDAATLFFVLHHVPLESYNTVMQELNRVLKNDGYLFVAEDLVDSEAERQVTERADRLINAEIASDSPHNYKSAQQWEAFFTTHGLRMVDQTEVKPQKVRHGFFVLQKKVT